MRPLRAGDRVQLTGKFLRNTGQTSGGEAHKTWTVVACTCGMCAAGKFVAVDEKSVHGLELNRHFNAANLFRKGTLVADNA